MNSAEWLKSRRCKGVAASEVETLFFSLKRKDEARALCRRCPVRDECCQAALDEEAGVPAVDRFGIRGGTTGAQRHSIELRGGLNGADPIQLIEGYDTSTQREVPEIPDDGDKWSRQHTQLARRVVRWLEQVEIGERVPTNTKIADELDVRNVSMLGRVMEALVADGTLDVVGNRQRQVGDNGNTRYYVKRGSPRALSSWLPIHLLDRGES